MNFTVERDQFEGMLARVQGVAERRHAMPVLSHLLLTTTAKAGDKGGKPKGGKAKADAE